MDCARCANLCESRTQIVKPDLPEFGRPCRLLVIGEAPGADEDREGIGFAGRAGKTLHRLLEEQGLRRGYDYGCANIVRCRPPDNRKPTISEIVNCMPHLVSTIAQAQPVAVLTVGSTAISVLTGIVGLEINIRMLSAKNHKPTLFRVDMQIAWPSRCRLYAIPHTSPLAWNRNAPDGRKWSAVGADVVSELGRFLQKGEKDGTTC